MLGRNENWLQKKKKSKRFEIPTFLEHIMIYAYEGSKDPYILNNPII